MWGEKDNNASEVYKSKHVYHLLNMPFICTTISGSTKGFLSDIKKIINSLDMAFILIRHHRERKKRESDYYHQKGPDVETYSL